MITIMDKNIMNVDLYACENTTRKSQVDNRLALLVIIMDNEIDYHPTALSSGH